ncbi:MAG: LysE family translocator [Burkholderiales bacterium]|nr:LysE family translocator [Burkholderiales bacterium]
MHEALTLAALIAALSIGVVSPGPSFIMIARMAVATSRAEGVAAALGMGVGGALFGALALAGLHALFTAVPTLFVGLKVAGGLYLCWLGVRIFMAAREPLDFTPGEGQVRPKRLRAFALGFTTQVSNPKTAVVYASVFAALLPATFSLGFATAVVACAFAVETAWYALVALALSAESPRRAYLGCKVWVDRAAGAVMGGLGVRLVVQGERLQG